MAGRPIAVMRQPRLTRRRIASVRRQLEKQVTATARRSGPTKGFFDRTWKPGYIEKAT